MKKLIIIAVCLAVGIAVVEAKEKQPATPAASTVALYDSVTPVEDADTVAALVKKATWARIAKDAAPGGFKGDAVLVNATLAAVARKDGSGIEVYAKGAEGWTRRTRLAAVAGGQIRKLGALKAVFDDETALEAQVVGTDGGAILFCMHAIYPLLKAMARGPVEALRLEAQSRFGVMPDFFAVDMMIDARKIPIERAEIPSENMFLHMVADGKAIVAALWEKNERDIEIHLLGEGEERVMQSMDVFFGSESGGVWTAVLEQPGIWHARDFTREEGIKGVTIVDWNVPFLAKWKGNFTREDGKMESMQFGQSRSGIKGGQGARRLTVSGKSRIDASVMNDPKREWYVGLSGPAVFYPLRRTEETPLDRLCIDDLLREGLGTGPCESILDSKSKKSWGKGIFTCSYRRATGHLFSPKPIRQREMAARIKEERYLVRRLNKNVLTFVKNVQDRINVYVYFGVNLMAYLDEQEKQHSELSASIKKLKDEWNAPVKVLHGERTLRGKEDTNARREENEDVAEGMLDDFYKALRVDTVDQSIKASGAGAVADAVGESGDNRLRQMRRKVMMMRGMATMEMAMSPAFGEIAKEVRKRTEEALRNPHRYEKATEW